MATNSLRSMLLWGILGAACGSDAADSEDDATSGRMSADVSNDRPPAGTFGDILSSNVRGRAVPPGDVEGAVDRHGVVALGTVVNLVPGRREALGESNDPDFYIQYQDLVIRPSEVLKGEIATHADIHVEFAWPSNLDTDELLASLPQGVRVLVLGERQTVVAAATPTTLLRVPSYGFILEAPEGATMLPFDNNVTFQKLVPSAPESFSELLSAISQTRQE